MKQHPDDPFTVNYKQGTPLSRKADRVRFMTEKRDVLEEKREGLKRITFEDWSSGIWMTPKQLNKELGDDPEATMNWIDSCIEAGPTQFKLNVYGFLNSI